MSKDYILRLVSSQWDSEKKYQISFDKKISLKENELLPGHIVKDGESFVLIRVDWNNVTDGVTIPMALLYEVSKFQNWNDL